MTLFPDAETVPDNVPENLIYSFDIYGPKVPDGEFGIAMRELRNADVPRIFWTPKNGGHWILTRAEEIDVVLNDAAHFSNRNIRVPKYANAVPPLKPLQVDPPEHTKYRALLMGALSPKAVNTLGVGARELAIELIEGLMERGECDFVQEFAHQMPIAIFMAMVDLPIADRPELLTIADKVVRPQTAEQRLEGFAELKAYLDVKIGERRLERGTDLISHLVHSQVDGEQMDDATLNGMLVLVMLAGLDTVASMLTCFAKFLAENPDHRRQLVNDPSMITRAVEELLRRYAIVNLGREVVTDIEIGGVTMKAGDMIICPTPLSNLDEDNFEDPLAVDFDRKVAKHATFGGGTHRCMGAMLARTELKIFLEEWLKRIPDFRIKPGAMVEATLDVTSIIPSLPLEWDPASTIKLAA